MESDPFLKTAARFAIGALLIGLLGACGGGGSTGDSSNASTSSTSGNSTSSNSGTSSGSSGTASNSLAAGYKQAKWGANMTVSYPSTCTMTIVSSGMPNHSLPNYYLGPAENGDNVVATTSDGLQLTVIQNPDSTNPIMLSFNICPSKASSPSTANMGTIGVMISGAALFNPYDATQDPALALNVSYKFTNADGQSETASFIDNCNGHYTNNNGGNIYHYHGNSSCVTSEVDTETGPSHLIGVALDGYPVYGGRDINGNTIDVAQLDSCNGITSPTPEFPNGVYHYVLPLGVTNARSSITCYTGTVSQTQVASAKALGICKSGRVAQAANGLPAAQGRKPNVVVINGTMTTTSNV